MKVVVFSNIDSGSTKVYQYSHENLLGILQQIISKGDYYIPSQDGNWDQGTSTWSLNPYTYEDLEGVLVDLIKDGDNLPVYEDPDGSELAFEIVICNVENLSTVRETRKPDLFKEVLTELKKFYTDHQKGKLYMSLGKKVETQSIDSYQRSGVNPLFYDVEIAKYITKCIEDKKVDSVSGEARTWTEQNWRDNLAFDIDRSSYVGYI